MREKILAYSFRYQGNWQKIAKAIIKDEEVSKVKSPFPYVTIIDREYPEKLRSLRFPPWLLFYEGDLSLCQRKSLGVVGSREATEYGKQCTRQICQTVKDHRVIVSGLAKGIDQQAHLAALPYATIGVIASGLDIVYPKENIELYRTMRQQHLIVSEYPPQVQPQKYHFPWRNRIIAALSDCIAVPQAKIRSGTLVTVNHAIEMGKEVYCIPYSLHDPAGEGCNELIYNGANILIHFDDLK